MSAAGVKPNALNALNRPPTFGSALMTRNPASRESLSRGEPGSVTITMWLFGSRPCFANSDSAALF